jgi:arsenate reductase
MHLNSKLTAYVDTLRNAASDISDDRRLLLGLLGDYIRARGPGSVDLVFICTHNSRRSIISQVWASVALRYFGFENVGCFSGGTEVTAFNPRARSALERAGFVVEVSSSTDPNSTNPLLLVTYSDDAPAVECFSKLFDHPVNPSSDFAAVMTCSEAEKNCPFIPDATRFSLPYEDPGVADGSPNEERRYDERVRQIGTELFYLADLVSG